MEMKNTSMIKKIMNDLLCEMEEGPDEFDSRLGRKKKPEVTVEIMELKPKKGENMDEDSASDEDEDDDSSSGYMAEDDEYADAKNFDKLSERIAEMKRKKRGY